MLKYACSLFSLGMREDCASCVESLDVFVEEATVTELVKNKWEIEELIDRYERGDRCYNRLIVY